MMDPFEWAPTFDDPIAMLRACHRRIERALDVMARVAAREESRGTLDAEAREALRATLHYFATGVPRHARDEEESLFPRLREQLEGSATVLGGLDALEQEHIAADAAHGELEQLGQGLLDTGCFLDPSERARFSERIRQLQELYAEHIRREDEEIFPLAEATLDAREQVTIGAEMAARRGIDWKEHRWQVEELAAHRWDRGRRSESV
jgi:hemerythrin-like domain-containing protein